LDDFFGANLGYVFLAMEMLKKCVLLTMSMALMIQSNVWAADGLRCRIIFDEPRLSALQQISQDQRTTLQTSLWQRWINGKQLKNFSADQYKQNLQKLLTGETTTSDQELWSSSEGKLALIEFLNITSSDSLKVGDMMTRLENMQAFRQRTLMKLVDQKLNANSAVSREFLDQWSRDLFLALRGANVRVLDYIKMKSDARLQKQMSGLVQEELLAFGLKGVLAELPLTQVSLKDRATILVRKVMAAPLFKWTSLMLLRLPEGKQIQLSDELMAKILIDGAEAHKTEIEKEFAPQIGRNRYEVARKIIGPMMAVATMAYFYVGEAPIVEIRSDEVATQVLEQQRNQDKLEISRTLTQTEIMTVQISNSMRALRYEKTITALHDQWGRWPNSSEMQELLGKIYGGRLSQKQIQGLVQNLYQDQVSLQDETVLRSIPDRINKL
jgi:hypothetical protein